MQNLEVHSLQMRKKQQKVLDILHMLLNLQECITVYQIATMLVWYEHVGKVQKQ